MHILWGLKQELHPACFISILIPVQICYLCLSVRSPYFQWETSHGSSAAFKIYLLVILRGQSKITLGGCRRRMTLKCAGVFVSHVYVICINIALCVIAVIQCIVLCSLAKWFWFGINNSHLVTWHLDAFLQSNGLLQRRLCCQVCKSSLFSIIRKEMKAAVWIQI